MKKNLLNFTNASNQLYRLKHIVPFVLFIFVSNFSFAQDHSTCALAQPLVLNTGCNSLPGGPGLNTGDPTGFDNTDGNICSTNYSGGDDFIFSYTGDGNLLSLALFATNTWTGILVTEGCPTTGTCFASKTSSSANETLVTPATTLGVVYYIHISTYPTPQSCGQFCLNAESVVPPTPPANDDCAGAISLTVNSDLICTTTTLGNTASATQSQTACIGSGADDDIWFSFMATSTSVIVELTAVSGSSDRVHEIFSGTCGNLTSIKCSDPETSTTTGLTVNQIYFIRVHTYSTGNNTEFNICLKTPPLPPANDDCAGAISLTVNSDLICTTTTLGNTTSATQSQTACVGSGADDDIWFSFMATSTSVIVELTTVSGSTDRVHQIFSGTCGNLTSINCSDPETSTTTGLTVNQIYFIRVHTYSTGNNTEFNICLKTPPPPPANDDCAGALPLMVSTSSGCDNKVSGTTNFATASSEDDCSTSHKDVWYTFTPATTGSYNFSVVETFDAGFSSTYVSVFSGSCGLLTQVGLLCSSSSLSNLALTGNQTYIINVRSTSSTSYVNFDLCVFETPPPPANDECVGAYPLTVNTDLNCGSVTAGTVLSATASPESTTSCLGTEDDDVWFSFVATATTHQISLLNITGSTSDMYHSLWTGGCGSLALVSGTCSDDNTSTPTGLTIGTTYFVRVYTWTGTTGQTSAFEVCVGSFPPPPVNDDPSGAITIAPSTSCSYNTYSNASATGTLGIPSPACGSYSTADVWFKIVVPASGRLAFATNTGTITDGGMAIYSSSDNTANGTFTLIECDDDDSPNGAMPLINRSDLTPGNTIFIRVWDYSDGFGTFSLCAFEPVANTSCEGATAMGVGSANTLTFQDPAMATVNPIGVNTFPSESGCTSIDEESDMYYIITTDEDAGELTVTLTPTAGLDVAAYLFQACANLTGTSLECANDLGAGGEETFTYTIAPGIVGNRGGSNRAAVDVILVVKTAGTGTFTVDLAGAALPIIIGDITAYEAGATNMVEWTTVSEINAGMMEIQTSADGYSWKTIGEKKPQGSSSKESFYSYTDESPAPMSYYRLKLIDLDGSFKYSDVVNVKRSKAKYLVNGVYPSPTQSTFTIDMIAENDGKATVSVINLVGRTVLSSNMSFNYGANKLEVDISNLPAGTYLINFLDNQGNKFIERITKI